VTGHDNGRVIDFKTTHPHFRNLDSRVALERPAPPRHGRHNESVTFAPGRHEAKKANIESCRNLEGTTPCRSGRHELKFDDGRNRCQYVNLERASQARHAALDPTRFGQRRERYSRIITTQSTPRLEF
jgi:hypothetical protein